MSSATTGAYFVSCVSGNKNDLLCWVLLFLLPKFLGTPFAYINFLLIQAIDRSPSAVGVLGNFGFSGFTKGGYKPSQTNLLFPANLPDTGNTEHIELDFSDVFGPVIVDLNNIDSTTGEPVEDVNELVYDDPPRQYDDLG
ncbi:uncharacterized protein HKW66_Vig0054640 [Vigna angularis]|uniref:Uncharacterized protein n=1 Tax=Phaseolus angularis TaxID=3914 RepID=A0A8T0L5J3_PHAAN|nr:uncharacterized protein HKW66_Vig0054640 [Vigna angularis]